MGLCGKFSVSEWLFSLLCLPQTMESGRHGHAMLSAPLAVVAVGQGCLIKPEIQCIVCLCRMAIDIVKSVRHLLHIKMAAEQILQVGMEGRSLLLAPSRLLFHRHACPSDVMRRMVLRDASGSNVQVDSASLLVLEPHHTVEHLLQPE